MRKENQPPAATSPPDNHATSSDCTMSGCDGAARKCGLCWNHCNASHSQPCRLESSCVMCGRDLNTGKRYCSPECNYAARREGLPRPMTFEEMQAEMDGVFERLRNYPDEGIS